MSDSSVFTRDEVRHLLQVTGDEQQALFARAREVRRDRCGDVVLLRGLIEISNYCQKKCDYCAMRAPNREMDRYRLTAREILDVVEHIKELGLNIAFLQGGQDPKCDEILEEVIPVIKRDIGLPVLLNLGERPRKSVYQRYVELGADSFIMKIEASDPELYRNTIHADINKRIQCSQWIKEVGMNLGTGNIVGLPGQTLEHVVNDIFFCYDFKPDFVSSSPFIPNEHTPFEEVGFGPISMTLNCMAIWRIMLGDPLIPTVSPLEKIQKGGQLAGLNAGANVMTINCTPTEWRDKYAIYSKERFVVTLDHAYQTIEKVGLKPLTKPVHSALEAAAKWMPLDPVAAAFEHRHTISPMLSLGRPATAGARG